MPKFEDIAKKAIMLDFDIEVKRAVGGGKILYIRLEKIINGVSIAIRDDDIKLVQLYNYLKRKKIKWQYVGYYTSIQIDDFSQEHTI